MYSRILVAIDDTEISSLVIEEAINLAKDQNAKLCITYVVIEFITGEFFQIDMDEYKKSVEKHGRSVLRKMMAVVKKRYYKVESRLLKISTPEEYIADKIIAKANQWQADVIVIGTHGKSGLTRLYLGSVCEDVIRHSSIPVHVVGNQDN